jgi:hypothetical protein
MRILGVFALLAIAIVSIALGQGTSTMPDQGFLTKDDMKLGAWSCVAATGN